MPDGSPARATADVESESVRLLGDLSNKLAKYLVAVRSDGRLSGGTGGRRVFFYCCSRSPVSRQTRLGGGVCARACRAPEMVLFINSCKEAVDDCLHVCEGEKRMRAKIAHEHGACVSCVKSMPPGGLSAVRRHPLHNAALGLAAPSPMRSSRSRAAAIPSTLQAKCICR